MMGAVREDLLEDCQLPSLGGSGLSDGELGLAAEGAVHTLVHSLLRVDWVGDRHSFDFMEIR